ncbi:uncharacterized protein [Temnothorax nylanderi]|uniref:uncharacterized protein n=1 Tax=Temnothorax nylanderi TaxID=102681 RepID=UPI003A8BE970
MATTQLSLAPKTIKYLMFAFNLFFVVTGIVLLSIGLVIHGVYHQYQHFLDNSFFSVPSLLVAVGSIIFIIAFFGCCGAARESYCMTITFCTLLATIFILEIIGGTLGYVMRAQVATVAREKMLDTMPKYNESKEIQRVWDTLQHNFDCCGTVNATDWTSPQMGNLTGIPMSCCDNTIGAVGTSNCTTTSPSLHPVGCITAFANFAEKHAAKIAGVGIGLAVIQLTGVMIISVGTTIYAVYENFSHFLDASYFSPATLLIVVGILVFIIAFMGCCGALRESTCMVLVFAVLLSFVLILELAAAVAAYALQDGIKDLLAEKINLTMHQYEKNEEAKFAIDFMQSRLRCCGYNSYMDWNNVPFNNTHIDVPDSCCAYLVDELSDRCYGKYHEGCISRLSIIVHRSALYIGTGAVAIALIQLTGIMFACMLGRAIRRQKTERERRRWELRENLVNGYEPLGKSDPVTTFPVVYMSTDYPLKGDQKS